MTPATQGWGGAMAGETLQAVFRRRGAKLGTMVIEFDTPGIGHILKACGPDFVFLDMEHSGFGIETVKRTLRYLEAAGLPTIVRPPGKDYSQIATALDVGAEGLMLPMLSSAAEAKRILGFMKYVPQGGRGVALGVAHDRYTAGPVMAKLTAANRRTTFVALIETAEGVANIDEIAATRGVDVLWIGHFDLSCSLGIPGEFEHPDFRRAIAAVLAAAKRHGKPLGRMVQNVKDGLAYQRMGFDTICYSGDVWLLQAALREGLDGLRAGTRGRGRGGKR